MTLKKLHIRKLAFLLAVPAITLYSCGGGDKEKSSEDVVAVDSTKTNLVNVNGALFSIPSPIETSLLLKKLGANYTKEILNPSSKSTSYSTNYKKALNLGVYGADLGYVTIYEQPQDAIGYLKVVKKLADDIGVSGAFDASLMKRFEGNLTNKDSLLGMTSAAYRASDSYLKDNERTDVSALIIAGGWVESLYFTTSLVKSKPNQDIANRIGEQKSSLDNLIKLLTPYYQQPEYTEFVDALIDLAYDFDGIEEKYTFIAPTTDVTNKVTTINSKSEVVITEAQLKTITEKINHIRTLIVG